MVDCNTEYVKTVGFAIRLVQAVLALVSVCVAAAAHQAFFRPRYGWWHFGGASSSLEYLEAAHAIVFITEVVVIVLYLVNVCMKISDSTRKILLLVITLLTFLFLFVACIVASTFQWSHFTALTAFGLILCILDTLNLVLLYQWFQSGVEHMPWPCAGQSSG